MSQLTTIFKLSYLGSNDRTALYNIYIVEVGNRLVQIVVLDVFWKSIFCPFLHNFYYCMLMRYLLTLYRFEHVEHLDTFSWVCNWNIVFALYVSKLICVLVCERFLSWIIMKSFILSRKSPTSIQNNTPICCTYTFPHCWKGK